MHKSRLHLITGPAGSGKTLALLQWLTARTPPDEVRVLVVATHAEAAFLKKTVLQHAEFLPHFPIQELSWRVEDIHHLGRSLVGRTNRDRVVLGIDGLERVLDHLLFGLPVQIAALEDSPGALTVLEAKRA
jgi:KaiC/GvpD/RAD55 family RecA-like ATPase